MTCFRLLSKQESQLFYNKMYVKKHTKKKLAIALSTKNERPYPTVWVKLPRTASPMGIDQEVQSTKSVFLYSEILSKEWING